MSIDMDLIPKSLIFDITAMGLRHVPVGRQRVFEDGDSLYKVFCILYSDLHPDLTEQEFFDVLRKIFPVYKNPRKNTENYKITSFKLEDRLQKLGMNSFPVNTFINKENLKIEL